MTRDEYRKFRVFLKTLTEPIRPNETLMEIYRHELNEVLGRDPSPPPTPIQVFRRDHPGLDDRASDSDA